MAETGNDGKDRFKAHPCFDPAARLFAARVHIPVAPACNIQCRYCDRRGDCPNETRPGVASGLVAAGSAGEYVTEVRARIPDLKVVGIAGPGDPFASPEDTLEAFRSVRRAHPDLILCAATNGLAAASYARELAGIGLSHLTVTVNAADPRTGAGIYAWIRDGKRVRTGEEGAAILLAAQLEAVSAYSRAGVTVKVNTVLVPGVNDRNVEDVAMAVKAAGASFMNLIPLLPVPGTPLGDLPGPGPDMIHRAREAVARHLPLLSHCSRCRADAAGHLGEGGSDWLPKLIKRYQEAPAGTGREPAAARPYVAVATMEGILIDQHLGEAREFLVFDPKDPSKPVAVRRAPPEGGGTDRWRALSRVLSDCSDLLVSGAGQAPSETLAGEGVKVSRLEGLISDALGRLGRGQSLDPLAKREEHRCGQGCRGAGTGCG
jgi:nitrogen fixation protein NifB